MIAPASAAVDPTVRACEDRIR